LVIEDIDAQGTVVHKRFKTLKTDNTQQQYTNNIFNTNLEPNQIINQNGNENISTNINQPSQIHQYDHTTTATAIDTATATALLALNTLMNNQKNNEIKKDLDKKEESKTQLTLSAILNQIDGVHNNHGMILIMTTNYPEKLDEALIRDGRVDERIFFDYCDYDQIHLMFKNFYNGNSIGMEIIKSHINLSDYKVAPCNVENSMRRYYSNQMAALEDIVNSIMGKKTFEKFDF
jgi:SpoVK/Ycf46/Vps4 family AAA+-type ATPase